jgi:hypothetical protein
MSTKIDPFFVFVSITIKTSNRNPQWNTLVLSPRPHSDLLSTVFQDIRSCSTSLPFVGSSGDSAGSFDNFVPPSLTSWEDCLRIFEMRGPCTVGRNSLRHKPYHLSYHHIILFIDWIYQVPQEPDFWGKPTSPSTHAVVRRLNRYRCCLVAVCVHDFLLCCSFIIMSIFQHNNY